MYVFLRLPNIFSALSIKARVWHRHDRTCFLNEKKNDQPVASGDLFETLAQVPLSHQISKLHVEDNTNQTGATAHLHLLQALPRGSPGLFVFLVFLPRRHLQPSLLFLLLSSLRLGVQPFLSLSQFLHSSLRKLLCLARVSWSDILGYSRTILVDFFTKT